VSTVERWGSDGPWEDVVGYSRVVRAGDRWITAGCTATIDGVLQCPDDAYGQAIVAFGVALDALGRAGAAATDVVRTRMYLVDPADADVVGRAHVELFGAVRPAATLVVVAALIDPAMRVEVEVEAFASHTRDAQAL
jgi:enamine deaminase RidA (YjgF/YER057c/UK114 family)